MRLEWWRWKETWTSANREQMCCVCLGEHCWGEEWGEDRHAEKLVLLCSDVYANAAESSLICNPQPTTNGTALWPRHRPSLSRKLLLNVYSYKYIQYIYMYILYTYVYTLQRICRSFTAQLKLKFHVLKPHIYTVHTYTYVYQYVCMSIYCIYIESIFQHDISISIVLKKQKNNILLRGPKKYLMWHISGPRPRPWEQPQNYRPCSGNGQHTATLKADAVKSGS